MTDAAIFDLVHGAEPKPVSNVHRVSICAMLASCSALAWVQLRSGSTGSDVPLMVLLGLAIVLGVVAVLSNLPTQTTAAQDADLIEGSRLMRAVVLERFGVAFAPENNATWLMKYGSQVRFRGELQTVRVVREDNSITLEVVPQ